MPLAKTWEQLAEKLSETAHFEDSKAARGFLHQWIHEHGKGRVTKISHDDNEWIAYGLCTLHAKCPQRWRFVPWCAHEGCASNFCLRVKAKLAGGFACIFALLGHAQVCTQEPAEGGNRIRCSWQTSGSHAEDPAAGPAQVRAEHARRWAHVPPLQAAAQLISENVPAEEIAVFSKQELFGFSIHTTTGRCAR